MQEEAQRDAERGPQAATAEAAQAGARSASREARSSIYRARALAAKERGMAAAEPLRIYPLWATWLVVSAGLLVAAALTAACVLTVEVTSLGRGIVRASGPPQVLATQVAGTVVTVLVRTGDRVSKGQEIAHLESASTRAALLEAARRLELSERSLAHFSEQRLPRYSALKQQLHARQRTLKRRAESERSSVQRMERRAERVTMLEAEGVASQFDAIENNERVAGMQRDALRTQEQRVQVGEEVTTLDARIDDEGWRLEMEVEEARLKHDSLRFTLDASSVRAPCDGVIGSWSARPGDPLAAGAPLGSIVAEGPPRAVVAYVPERDRAFIEKGARARVEVDQLPVWEFKALQGRVLHIASEIASERDLRDTLGDQARVGEPMYRIDLELVEDGTYAELRSRLRPESLTSVRFTLRERRIASLLVEPLYEWLH